MSRPALPDAEATVIGWLKGCPDITAVVGQRIHARFPEQVTMPAIRVTRVGGSPDDPWRDAPQIQVDCWADPQRDQQAQQLAGLVCAHVDELRGHRGDGSVIVAPHVINGPLLREDDQTGQPSYLVEIGYEHFP